jgi:DNA polymerase-3 subunit epsilon
MKPSNKYWLFVSISVALTIFIVTGLCLYLWYQLSPEEKQLTFTIIKDHFIYIFGAGFVLLAGFGFLLDGIFNNYILPLNKLIEEVNIISSVNASHRINMEGSKEIVKLSEIINEGAQRFEEMRSTVAQKIQLAKADLEEERNLLATFMAELPEGVLICNTEGRILFYNKQAKFFLEGKKEEDGETISGKFIGLGRSVFNVIDKNVIVHALDEIAVKLKKKEPNAVSYFVIVGKNENLLRVEAAPVLSSNKQLTGFLLIIFDISQQLDIDYKVDLMLKSLSRDIRASVASIRAAIEAIVDYPSMDRHQRQIFDSIIHKESVSLGEILDGAAIDRSTHLHSQWPLVQMPARDLLETIQQKAEHKLNVHIDIEGTDSHEWVKVDSYSIISAMLFVIRQVQKETGLDHLFFTVNEVENFVNIDLIWEGYAVTIETIRKWDDKPLYTEDEGVPLTLKEIIGHHEAEIWSYSCEGCSDRSYLRFCLPAVESPESNVIRTMTILPESRPEFYDFDLFNQPGQNPELDNSLLTELTYTVFDTETTGLDPKGGDEIIAIGAVRIVNGRLLHEESFDQLIDPKRSVPPESTAIHGIQPDMLVGQPTIEEVLPLFHKYAEDTILVAHNAAFDMRMLEMKEKSTGIHFINPVLDTLLLAALAHPSQHDQNLEAITKRFGISILGRHTALGDAIATAEMFLKFIPLLSQMGILTLKEARQASKKTYYSRLRY